MVIQEVGEDIDKMKIVTRVRAAIRHWTKTATSIMPESEQFSWAEELRYDDSVVEG